MKALAFSMNRTLQCDGMLRSLKMHATDPVDVTVLWKATTDRHLNSYDQLIRLHPDVTFEHEASFEYQVRKFLADAGEHVLFLVDDTIFVREWSANQAIRVIRNGHIGFSLRLGKNTTHCYPIGRDQTLPLIYNNPNVATWQWPGADGDFGYPLELSSSIYKTTDVIHAIGIAMFNNPNSLEVVMAQNAHAFAINRSFIASYNTSVAFSNPCNKVQDIFYNRHGVTSEMTSDALLDQWQRGNRMSVESYNGHVPTGAHQEMPIVLERRPGH